jgi:hypothetical protein
MKRDEYEEGHDPKWKPTRGARSGLGLGELLVAFFDGSSLSRGEALKKGEKLGGLEAFEQMIGLGAVVGARGADDDDRQLGIEFFKSCDEIATGHIADAGIEDNAMQTRKRLEGVDGFECAVGGDDVEFGGLDDEFARGDAAGVLTVDDEEAGPNHPVIIERFKRFGKGPDHTDSSCGDGMGRN